MSQFKGECVECGSITALNQAGICGDCYNDRDESWLENLNFQQAKEFALENLTCYKDENEYYSLKINGGDLEDIRVLCIYIFEDDEAILETIAKESKVYYQKIFGRIFFKSKEDFDIFFNLLINKIKEKMEKPIENNIDIREKVINNIKAVWETNPEISFGKLLKLIENNTNLTIYQLSDENIINLTTNMNIKDYINIDKIINSLQIDTVYNADEILMGYKITFNGKRLNDEKALYNAMTINFEDDVESLIYDNLWKGLKYQIIDNEIVFKEKIDAFDIMKKIKDFLKENSEQLEG